MVKEFVFELPWGTIGDQKPLAILAVYAAHALSSLYTNKKKSLKTPPVTVITWDAIDTLTWLTSVMRFARVMVGERYQDWLQIEQITKPLHAKRKQHAIVFTAMQTSWAKEELRDQRIPLDFGDNYGTNRFTSSLLAPYRPHSPYFGSLYLPIRRNFFQWADTDAKKELLDFVKQHKDKKLLAVAGSLRAPFDIQSMLEWVEEQQEGEWVILLLGYNSIISNLKLQTNMMRNRHRIYAFQHSLPYEDVVAMVDFFVSNCGAGSVTAPLAAGCPQMCRVQNTVGADKSFNEKVVAEDLRVGPLDKKGFSFTDLMTELAANHDTFISNAVIPETILHKELLSMQHNLQRFFTDLWTNVALQDQMRQTGIVPREYALGE